MLPPVEPQVPSDEAPVRQLAGVPGRIASGLAVGLALYALYWVLFIIQPQVYRISFLLIALVLTFLLFPFRRGGVAGGRSSPADAGRTTPEGRYPSLFDWGLVALTVVALSWPLIDFGAFVYRAANPRAVDLVLGA